MNIPMGFSLYIVLFVCVIPAFLAVMLARKQNRSMLISGSVTFVLGFTWLGGWIYLGCMNLMKPKDNQIDNH